MHDVSDGAAHDHRGDAISFEPVHGETPRFQPFVASHATPVHRGDVDREPAGSRRLAICSVTPVTAASDGVSYASDHRCKGSTLPVAGGMIRRPISTGADHAEQ